MFIGMGHNPEGPDLPSGLGMLLAQDPKAMAAFVGMSAGQKEDMVRYIQGGATGSEAKARMAEAINRLHGGTVTF